ncbi:MAG: LysR substrate-binding domain-containing protein [Myxococcaceae bacterium]
MIPNDAELGLQGWRVVATVAETGGFSAAARRLGLSKATVSTTVTRVEALGVKLFQRTTRRLALTEAGAASVPHAQRALAAARDATEAATQARLSPRGTLRVSAPMSFGLLHVAPALGAFAASYPELKVELVLDDHFVDLVAGGFDLALRIGELADSALIATRLGTHCSVVVAAPAWVARAGTPRNPEALEGAPSSTRWPAAATGGRSRAEAAR